MRSYLLPAVMAAFLVFPFAATADSPPPRVSEIVVEAPPPAPSPTAALPADSEAGREARQMSCKKVWLDATSLCEADSGRCNMNAGLKYASCINPAARK